jgi:hypothetical protein
MQMGKLLLELMADVVIRLRENAESGLFVLMYVNPMIMLSMGSFM